MDDLAIRPAQIADSPAISRIHRGCEDPWQDSGECARWISRRIGRGFYIQAAVREGRVIGHGEWIISHEPRSMSLYLGLLQVDEDFHRQGVGSAMIADGIRYARRNGCAAIATVPDADTGAEAFYRKCEFRLADTILRCRVPTQGHNGDFGVSQGAEVPFSAIREKPFLFGLCQTSSRHMWEVCNGKPDSDTRLTPAVRTAEGSFLQLSYFPGDLSALVLCWAGAEEGKNIVKSARAFGASLGLNALEFVFRREHAELFAGEQVLEEGVEMVLEV